MNIIKGHALDLIPQIDEPLDLIVTDPPYAFGGNGAEHAVSATVACVLRETAEKLRRGSWMVVLCASSWRSINYMIESVRGIVEPVRIGSWVKPASKTKVRTPGWEWSTVAAIAMRRGPKNRKDLPDPAMMDWLLSDVVTDGRRAQLPAAVADWAVSPFAIADGNFLDPFAGSGALVLAAERCGMRARGFEINPPEEPPIENGPCESCGREGSDMARMRARVNKMLDDHAGNRERGGE